jgi:hypothetical protein
MTPITRRLAPLALTTSFALAPLIAQAAPAYAAGAPARAQAHPAVAPQRRPQYLIDAYYVSTYNTLGACGFAGNVGLIVGVWNAYACRLFILRDGVAHWELWASDFPEWP